MIILSTLTNPFFSRIIKSIEEAASKDGYYIIISTTDGKPEKLKATLLLLRKVVADGAIFRSGDIPKEYKAEVESLASTMPVVQCCEKTDIPSIPEVRIDDFSAMYEMVQKMIKAGKKRIMYLSNDNTLPSTYLRLKGYKQALKENNIEFDEALILKGNYGYRNAHLLTSEFIKSKIPFDSVVCNSDRMAAGAISALLENGIKIPDDVFVGGFDNIDLCHMVTPSITTISQNRKAIGAKAYELLKEKLNGGEAPKTNIMRHSIIERNSTKL